MAHIRRVQLNGSGSRYPRKHMPGIKSRHCRYLQGYVSTSILNWYKTAKTAPVRYGRWAEDKLDKDDTRRIRTLPHSGALARLTASECSLLMPAVQGYWSTTV
jgi:hypothetical protein